MGHSSSFYEIGCAIREMEDALEWPLTEENRFKVMSLTKKAMEISDNIQTLTRDGMTRGADAIALDMVRERIGRLQYRFNMQDSFIDSEG